MNKDTIVAWATPEGRSALAMLRLSGPEAFRIASQLFKKKDLEKAKSHTLHVGLLMHEGASLDEGVVSVFKAPRSYTGEDMAEISCHGNPYVVQKILEALCALGARPARAGEFTQRAFLHGKIDLAQAEAVAALIEAGAEQAHRAALYQLRGGISTDLKGLRAQLLELVSLLELELDFFEEDLAFADRKALKELLGRILDRLRRMLAGFRMGKYVREGIPTAIVGKPNAGKSTLLNALLGEERALVSPQAGTTRDSVEEIWCVQGLLFRLTDTAGLRKTKGLVEGMGVRRTAEKMKAAALILYLWDLSAIRPEKLKHEMQSLRDEHADTDVQIICVGNKVDLLSVRQHKAFETIADLLMLSAQQGAHLEVLQTRMVAAIQGGDEETARVLITARHYEPLLRAQKAAEAANRMLGAANSSAAAELLAAQLREALDALGEITGEVSTEDILGHIFGKFCIGK